MDLQAIEKEAELRDQQGLFDDEYNDYDFEKIKQFYLERFRKILEELKMEYKTQKNWDMINDPDSWDMIEPVYRGHNQAVQELNNKINKLIQ